MKDNDNYVYLGNHRYIRKDLMEKAVEEYNKKLQNNWFLYYFIFYGILIKIKT